MSKEKISATQILTLTLLMCCGFVIPLLAYEHLSGGAFYLHLLIGALIAAALSLPLRPLYHGRAFSAGQTDAFDKAALAVLAAFVFAALFVSFSLLIDFWVLYDYRSNTYIYYAVFIAALTASCSCFGHEVQARLSLLLLLIPALILLLNFAFLLPQMEAERLLPVEMSLDAASVRQILYAAALFMPAFIALLLYKHDLAQLPRQGALFAVMALAVAGLLLTMLRTVLVLGRSAQLYAYPYGQTLKLIHFHRAIGGMELFGIMGVMGLSLGYLVSLNGALAYMTGLLSGRRQGLLPHFLPSLAALLLYLLLYDIPIHVLKPYFQIAVLVGAGACFIVLLIKKIKERKKENALTR